jgi:NitT/TauT family transport system substrate-binding protein
MRNHAQRTVTGLATAVLVAMALVIAACGSSGGDDSTATSASTGSTSSTAAAPAADGGKIRVALVPAATANLPIQIADLQGMFKDAGLDVELSTPSLPFSQLPAALGKQFDIVIGSQPDLIRSNGSGIDVVAVAGLQKDNPKDPGAALVVGPDSPIKSLKDLEGKTVGAPSIVGNNWTALQCWAQKEGLSPTAFKGLEGPTPQLPDLLKQKRFDSILIFEPLLTPAGESGDVNLGNAYEKCFGGNEYTSMLLAQGEWAKSHGADITKFLGALDKAKQQMAADPTTAKELYVKTSGLPPEAAQRTPIIPEEFDFSQGQTLVDDLQTWADLLNSLGTYKGNVDPSNLVAEEASS